MTIAGSRVIQPLELTDLHDGEPGLRRAVHAYGTAGSWRRVVRRYWSVMREVLGALPRDLALSARSKARRIVRMEDGVDPVPGASCAALYVHYAPSGRVSDMVLCQLRSLREAGFAVMFLSSASNIPEPDWQAVRTVCAVVVQRRNFGLDFGAWQDAVPEIHQRWPDLTQLMLANDSVLGPLHPMPPIIQALRSGGNGLFGLTESLQGGAHLQSYMLLANGRLAVADVLGFLETLFISHSKWLLVQAGELRLARWMRRRGHRVAALYAYERLVRVALSDPAERYFFAEADAPLEDIERRLHHWPANPTQHFWHTLATCFGAPFIKTELVRRNPAGLSHVETWPDLVAADAPCGIAVIRAHLEAMTPP